MEENIDLLGMAPETESPVIKMKQYSKEFEAGQVGMILVNANVSGDFNDDEISNDDPVEILEKIDSLEASLNSIENTTAVSVVFLMKASGVQVTVSGEQVSELFTQVPCLGSEACEDVKATAEVLINQSASLDTSFWDLLTLSLIHI